MSAERADMGNPANNLISECRECGLCLDACGWLASAGESPAALARRGIRAEEAFNCSLCGRCETVCPLSLKPYELFAARREQAVERGEIDIGEYSYLLPDRPESGMRRYRQYYGIDYGDIEAGPGTDTCFFPGCALLTYAPGLTRELYRNLYDYNGCRGLISDCCGKPLSQMGLSRRAEQAAGSLMEKISRTGARKLIIACPGCYYRLREALGLQGLEFMTIYEALAAKEKRSPKTALYTVHDSCPDRGAGIFAGQVRQALSNCGYSLVEMPHNRKENPCCGSGGQIAHFCPPLAEALVNKRLEEAEATGANTLVAYCLSCVLNFAGRPSHLQVKHALNLLLGYDEDYMGVKDRAREIYENPAER